MKLKTNVIVGAIFALLLAFVYFHEIKGDKSAARRQSVQSSWLTLKSQRWNGSL